MFDVHGHSSFDERVVGQQHLSVVTASSLSAIDAGDVELTCVYTGAPSRVDAASIVLVSSMIPNDALYYELMSDESALANPGIKRVTRLGDCYAPGVIAVAVYAGHEYARELGVEKPDEVRFERELVELAQEY